MSTAYTHWLSLRMQNGVGLASHIPQATNPGNVPSRPLVQISRGDVMPGAVTCSTVKPPVEMAEETVSKDVEMKDVEGGEEKSEKEEASGSQQQKDKNLLIFEGKETELRKILSLTPCLREWDNLSFWAQIGGE